MSAKKTIIRYFTGTGNTKRIADRIGTVLSGNDAAVDLAPITPDAPIDPSAERYVFCSPVYALGLPRIIKRYLAGLPRLDQPRPAMMVVTAGNPEHTGWALRHGRDLLDARNCPVSVSETIHMPDNWTPFLPTPPEAVARERLEAGDELAGRLALDFLAGKERHRPFSLAAMTPAGSWVIHQGFHRVGIGHLWSLFRTNKACTSCGLCEKSCPVGAITMAAGRPKWSKTCEQCSRCFNLCPARAIEQLDIVGRGSTRERYCAPGFKP
jgi:ferredoxin